MLGFFWVGWWLLVYQAPEKHPSVTPAELAHIRSDPPEAITPVLVGRRSVRYRQTWAFAIGKFMTDPIWWLYLFWIPDFLRRNYGLDPQIDRPADRRHLSRGRRRQHWRRVDVVAAAEARLEHQRGAQDDDAALRAVRGADHLRRRRRRTCGSRCGLVAIAAAAHQGWSANIFTLTSDMFPRRAVGSVVGIGGMAGAVGGMVISLVVGEILQRTGSYVPVFLIAGFAYLTALLVIHLLAPKLEGPKPCD